MVDPIRLSRPGAAQRIKAALDSGVDPYSYAVSAAKLRTVIREGPGNESLKTSLLEYLEREVIGDNINVSCIALGKAVGEFAFSTNDLDIILISRWISDLDRLPYTIANGQPVS